MMASRAAVRAVVLAASGLRRVTWDDFTAADGTALTSHTAPDGNTWTRHTSLSTGAGDPTIDGNRAHNDTNTHSSYVTGVSFADGVVACDVVMRSDNNLSNCGVIGRAQTAATVCYHAQYTTNGNLWRLYKIAAGNVFTLLGSTVGQTLTVDQPYRLELRMQGDRIALAVDNAEIVVVNDTTIAPAGVCGIWVSNTGASTTGLHLDNFEAKTR